MKFRVAFILLFCFILLSGCREQGALTSTPQTGQITDGHPTSTDPAEPTEERTDSQIPEETGGEPATDGKDTTEAPDTKTPENNGTYIPDQSETPAIPTPTPVSKTPYGALPLSPAVDKSYFDDAMFIGDSVSVALKTYSLTGAIGKANVIALGSYSLREAIKPLDEATLIPSYQGVDMTVADCVAACGAKKVYIMLGMNDIAFGIDKATERYKILVEQIREKSPHTEIFVQSMTPMLFSSNIYGRGLDNPKIDLYNQSLSKTCLEEGWYFVDVCSAMYDNAKEQLRIDYCSDPSGMGIHLNMDGVKAWVDYLLTHTAVLD